jgi:D-alanyl-lipoteichoic acid acyltransferase DltB (MBOAT superfamily)
MNYLSIEFVAAFLAFFPLYWAARARVGLQKALLLAASYGFYATWDWRFAAMLFAFSCVVWLGGVLLVRAQYRETRRPLLVLLVGFCLGYLALLKYFDFFRESLQRLLAAAALPSSLPALDVLLPIGVSFYTFHSIAYLVALYREERLEPARFGDLLLFIAFFPSLLAGPILRPEGMLAQIASPAPRRLTEPGFALWLIALGVAKKLVVATWLAAEWVDPMFADPGRWNGIELAFGAMAYAVQIFCDFSGYTDVVTGVALLLGYCLPVNFRQPYLAADVKDFWRRWHISLSTFIRDFVYVPLGGNRCGLARAQVNVLVAMALSGLWHGADTKYLIWGLLHGAGVVACNAWAALRAPALPRPLAVALTFAFVTFAWIFFRADSTAGALAYLRAMLVFDLPFQTNLARAAVLLAVFFALSAWTRHCERGFLHLFRGAPWLLRAAAAMLIAVVLVELGPSGVPPFIYFQY